MRKNKILLRLGQDTAARIQKRAEALGWSSSTEYVQRLIVRDLLLAEGDCSERELQRAGLTLMNPKKTVGPRVRQTPDRPKFGVLKGRFRGAECKLMDPEPCSTTGRQDDD